MRQNNKIENKADICTTPGGGPSYEGGMKDPVGNVGVTAIDPNTKTYVRISYKVTPQGIVMVYEQGGSGNPLNVKVPANSQIVWSVTTTQVVKTSEQLRLEGLEMAGVAVLGAGAIFAGSGAAAAAFAGMATEASGFAVSAGALLTSMGAAASQFAALCAFQLKLQGV